MLEDVLDVQSWNESGYRSLVFSDGWRAAMLNDVSRFYRENVNELQRHNTSDELFILLRGHCELLIGEVSEEQGMILNRVTLKPNVFYTVRRGVWHSHILEKDTSVAVIENADVGQMNTDYMALDLSTTEIRETGEAPDAD